MKWLPDYLANWRSRGREGRHISMKRWLEERRWEGFTRHAPTHDGLAKEVGVRVYAGTPEAEAWARHLKTHGRRFVAITRDGRGLYALKETLWPPREERLDCRDEAPFKDAGNVAAEVALIERQRNR